MINLVTVVGLLKEADLEKCIRYIEIEREYKNENGVFVHDKIPLMYWTRDAKNRLFSFKEDSIVIIKGRLEKEVDLIYILVEAITFLHANSNKNIKVESSGG